MFWMRCFSCYDLSGDKNMIAAVLLAIALLPFDLHSNFGSSIFDQILQI